MRVVCDIETDSLTPTKIWCIVCKEIDNGGTIRTWTCLNNFAGFDAYAKRVSLWIGHNFLGFDLWAINRLVKGVVLDPSRVVDTLIVSRLRDFRMDGGHSLENWGKILGKPKIDFKEFSNYSQAMLTYCIGDVDLNAEVFEFLKEFIYDPANREALRLEHDIAVISHELHTNGFYFDRQRAEEIYRTLGSELQTLYTNIQLAFPPRATAIREVVPRSTKSGALHAGDFRWITDGDLTPFSPGAAFSRIEWREFNPGSPKQVVERFNEFGWNPYVKTDGHFEAERELKSIQRRLRRPNNFLPPQLEQELHSTLRRLEERLKEYEVYGWKISEENLATLPDTAPPEAWLLIKWKLLEKRRQTLEEWFGAYNPDTGRIHGNFNGIGTWTHRFSHSNPNMGNVPSIDSKYNSEELKERAKHYGKKLRSLWCVPSGRRLVGVDAEGIQLRILAHYINDEQFIRALVSGDKEQGTDVHTLNAVKLGLGAGGRSNAKTFIYAWLLGAGMQKIAKILDTNLEGARLANERFLDETPGLRYLKEVVIPQDAENGFFIGVDGRKVLCDNDHLMLAGYLQNGESVVMKRATTKWYSKLKKEKIPFLLVNYVHDEWQTETEDDDDLANYIADTQIQAIVDTGKELGLLCPLAGSKSLGYNWYETH